MKQKLLRFEPRLIDAVENFQKVYFINTFNAAITKLVLDGLNREHLNTGGIWPAVKAPVKKSLSKQKVRK